MKANKVKMNGAERIRMACEGIIGRSDEIVTSAEPAKLFSRKEIRVTNEICCELALAVADSESVDDLVVNGENFERMRAHVMAANETLVGLTLSNPQTMSSIMNAEDTLIDLLVAADPTVRLMAGFAKKYLPVVKSTLTAFFTDIRLQLEAVKDRCGRRLLGALYAPVGAMVIRNSRGLLQLYGDGRCERLAALAFMRTLYDENSPERCSWPKVVNYVRTCSDRTDPNFARCVEIRLLVKERARKVKDGAEKVWRSLAQQLKPANGRKRGSGLAWSAIPDRSWS